MKKIIAGITAVLLINTANAGDCDYSRKIEREVDLNGVSELLIEAGAGSLEIVGEVGRENISIDAKLCSPDEDMLEKMEVIAEVNANKAHFETAFPNRPTWNMFNHSMYIDLVLTVPATAILEVRDSSGEASVENVAQLSMTDSSGQLLIERINGDLVVEDSSGEMRIKHIAGNVELTDSSGAIIVSDVTGSVLVIADSSGSIEAKRIGKDVTVERDSSGSIEVNDVGGNFVVLRDSSGGIRFKNVDGKVELPN